MSGINSVVLVGRLTKDVEVRKTSQGTSYARFTVACDRRYSSGQNGQQNSNQPTADFIGCVAWRQSADFLGSYGRKGSLVGVNGSIQTGSYTDRDGRKVYTTDVVADRVQLLESKNRNQENTGAMYSAPEPQEPAYSPNTGSAMEDFNTGSDFNNANDDLPF